MSAPSELIATIRNRVQSGECDLRDVGRLLTGKWDQDAPAILLDHIAALEGENARLVKERDGYRFSPQGDNHHNALKCPYCNPGMVDFEAKATAAEAEREALREALAPFAKEATEFNDEYREDWQHAPDNELIGSQFSDLTFGDFRRARALLPRQDDSSGKGEG